jgi:hypothetical protein
MQQGREHRACAAREALPADEDLTESAIGTGLPAARGEVTKPHAASGAEGAWRR